MDYAIACGHEDTAKAAVDVLDNGGNAIDAAIAAFTCSWIAEPCMSSPGGGAFAVIRWNDKYYSLDGFAHTPIIKKQQDQIEYIPVEVDFGDTTEVFYTGHGSIAVPGAIDGIYQMHELAGSIPMKELIHPAIQYAKNGILLNEFQHHDITLLRDILRQSSRGKELFFHENEIVPIGTNIAMPRLADFLDYLSREGKDAFYQGEVASKIAMASEDNGGHLTLNDLKNYKAQLSTGLRQKFNHSDIYTIGSPSMGGNMLIHLLQTLESHKTYSESALVKALDELTQLKNSGVFHRSTTSLGGLKEGGTSHISIVDKDHNAVSLSMSNGEGSSCFVKGTDIHLNNMLGEESLLPNGIHSWIENARMRSMMTPTLITNNDQKGIAAIGSGGASRIPSMIGQVIYHHLAGGLDISKAIDHPRIHLSNDAWQAEPGFNKPNDVQDKNWVQWKNRSLYFGGTHCASEHEGNYTAIGDSRRHGVGIQTR